MTLKLLSAMMLTLAAATAADAGTLLDRLKPYIGKPVDMAMGRDVYSATLLSVDDDYFCVVAHIPDFEHERCYSRDAISYIAAPVGKRPFWIAVNEPSPAR